MKNFVVTLWLSLNFDTKIAALSIFILAGLLKQIELNMQKKEAQMAAAAEGKAVPLWARDITPVDIHKVLHGIVKKEPEPTEGEFEEVGEQDTESETEYSAALSTWQEELRRQIRDSEMEWRKVNAEFEDPNNENWETITVASDDNEDGQSGERCAKGDEAAEKKRDTLVLSECLGMLQEADQLELKARNLRENVDRMLATVRDVEAVRSALEQMYPDGVLRTTLQGPPPKDSPLVLEAKPEETRSKEFEAVDPSVQLDIVRHYVGVVPLFYCPLVSCWRHRYGIANRASMIAHVKCDHQGIFEVCGVCEKKFREPRLLKAHCAKFGH